MTASPSTPPPVSKPPPSEDLPAAVAKAKDAQRAWAALTPFERITVVRHVKDRVLDRGPRIAQALHEEIGKPEVEALLSEVIPTADLVSWWCDSIEELLDPEEVPLDALSFPGKRGVIHREARGVVAVIMPWNFP